MTKQLQAAFTKHRRALIAGGVILAVAIVLYMRSRGASSTATTDAALQPDSGSLPALYDQLGETTGGGGGGSTTPPPPPPPPTGGIFAWTLAHGGHLVRTNGQTHLVTLKGGKVIRVVGPKGTHTGAPPPPHHVPAGSGHH